MIKPIRNIALVICLTLPGISHGAFWPFGGWTEEKLDKTLNKLDKAADQEHWRSAIHFGEKALKGCLALRDSKDYRCITIMRKNASHYYRAGVHSEHDDEIASAYHLARSELGIDHYNTKILREIQYQVLLRQRRYKAAIPVLQETLQVQQADTSEPFKILELTLQLYGLYHLTDQIEQEEMTLKTLLPMIDELVGRDGEDYQTVLLALAENYCLQKKYHEFFTLAREHNLDLHCASESPH